MKTPVALDQSPERGARDEARVRPSLRVRLDGPAPIALDQADMDALLALIWAAQEIRTWKLSDDPLSNCARKINDALRGIGA